MRTCKKMTFEEHKELGEKLKQVRKTLIDADVFVSNRYGKTKPAAKRAEKALAALESFRSVMDDIVCNEVESNDALRCYYGGE